MLRSLRDRSSPHLAGTRHSHRRSGNQPRVRSLRTRNRCTPDRPRTRHHSRRSSRGRWRCRRRPRRTRAQNTPPPLRIRRRCKHRYTGVRSRRNARDRIRDRHMRHHKASSPVGTHTRRRRRPLGPRTVPADTSHRNPDQRTRRDIRRRTTPFRVHTSRCHRTHPPRMPRRRCRRSHTRRSSKRRPTRPRTRYHSEAPCPGTQWVRHQRRRCCPNLALRRRHPPRRRSPRHRLLRQRRAASRPCGLQRPSAEWTSTRCSQRPRAFRGGRRVFA